MMLAHDVQAVFEKVEPAEIDFHYLNLSRGLLAVGRCHMEPGSHVDFCRIQSSWCEQKRWNDILTTLPPGLWIALAMGRPVTVHDQSEKVRETRAVWQGLSWIRYAVNSAWDLPVDPEYSRHGMNVSSYWAKEFVGLPKSTRSLLRYYENFYRGQGDPVDLCGCDVCGKGAANGEHPLQQG